MHKTQKIVRLGHQRGVAVITALLLTTLAITIVASLFWQQQVQVRSMENQRLQLQTKWILRGALDWARLILREDAKFTHVDHLGEPWAVALAETRLDDYIEKGHADNETTDAALSGNIIDAQSRYNLRGLAENRIVDPVEVKVFQILLSNLRLNPELALSAAEALASSQTKPLANGPTGTTGTPNTGTETSGKAENASEKPLGFTQIEDLLAVPGFTQATLLKLQDYIIFLPTKTEVNVNTASAEVVSAKIPKLSLADAKALVASRDRAYFKDKADFKARLQGLVMTDTGYVTETSYFIVTGKVHLDRALLETRSLIQRTSGSGTTKVIWIREN